MSGCLVTEEIDFVEPNVPPRLVDDPAGNTPIGQIIEIEARKDADEVIFSVLIEDDNIGQRFDARFRSVTLDGDGQEIASTWDLITSGVIPPLPDRVRISIPQSYFMEGADEGQCGVLELVVSSGFVSEDLSREEPVPIIDGDVARASWIVWFVNPDTGLVDVATCPSRRARQ